MIRHAKNFLPLTTLQTMYKSIVKPYFRFCCPVWGFCGITALGKLQKLQNRAARIVTDSSYKTSASPIIEKLGWPTVNDLIETETLKMVYKSINQLAPEYLTSMFIKLSKFSNRQLRDSDTDFMSLSKKRYVAKKVSAIEEQSFGTIKKLKRKSQIFYPICEVIKKTTDPNYHQTLFYLDILILSYVDSFINIVNM